MSSTLGILIAIVVSLLLGAGGMWLWNRLRRREGEAAAKVAVENSIKSDADREKIQKEIQERIKKNEEIRKRLEEKLKSL